MEAQLVTANCPLSWEEEEQLKRMTLQVCLIGKDGFVLASDKKGVAMSHLETTTTFTAEKIYMNEEWGAAWCSSGHSTIDNICQEFADRLRSQTTNETSSDYLRTLLKGIIEDYGKRHEHDPLGGGTILLAMQRGHELFGYWLDICQPISGKWGIQSGKQFEDKKRSGDIRNAAVFFVEQYYCPNATVEQLIPLAAHTILSGARLNPSGIGGLDIVVSQSGVLRKFSKAEARKLTARSAKLDKRLARELSVPFA